MPVYLCWWPEPKPTNNLTIPKMWFYSNKLIISESNVINHFLLCIPYHAIDSQKLKKSKYNNFTLVCTIDNQLNSSIVAHICWGSLMDDSDNFKPFVVGKSHCKQCGSKGRISKSSYTNSKVQNRDNKYWQKLWILHLSNFSICQLFVNTQSELASL